MGVVGATGRIAEFSPFLPGSSAAEEVPGDFGGVTCPAAGGLAVDSGGGGAWVESARREQPAPARSAAKRPRCKERRRDGEDKNFNSMERSAGSTASRFSPALYRSQATMAQSINAPPKAWREQGARVRERLRDTVWNASGDRGSLPLDQPGNGNSGALKGQFISTIGKSPRQGWGGMVIAPRACALGSSESGPSAALRARVPHRL